MRLAKGPRDGMSANGPKLTAMTVIARAVVRIFRLNSEMVTFHDLTSGVGELRVVVKWPDHAATGTLEDGEHELGDFETSSKKHVIVLSISVHRDRSWDFPRTSSLDEPRQHLSGTEVRGVVCNVVVHRMHNGWSIAPSHGKTHVASPIRPVLFPVGALSSGKRRGEAVAHVLLLASRQCCPGTGVRRRFAVLAEVTHEERLVEREGQMLDGENAPVVKLAVARQALHKFMGGTGFGSTDAR